jgi:hypothetical protein
MDISSCHHLRVNICRRLVSLFMTGLLLHVPKRKITRILSILKKLLFADLQYEAVHWREIQRGEIEKVIEIEECDDKEFVTHQKVVILV